MLLYSNLLLLGVLTSAQVFPIDAMADWSSIHNSDVYDWRTSFLFSNDNFTMDAMRRFSIIHDDSNTCLDNTNNKGHSRNNRVSSPPHTSFIKGTTYWINEWFQVGHILNELPIFQVMYTTKIDRIIFQRCCLSSQVEAREYFKGLVALLVGSYSSSAPVPFYIRDSECGNVYDAYNFIFNASSGKVTEVINKSDRMIITSHTCFEHVIDACDKRNNNCNRQSVSTPAVLQFKNYIYNLFPFKHYSYSPFIISLINRPRGFSRQIGNFDFFCNELKSSFTSPKHEVRCLYQDDLIRNFSSQVTASVQSDVLILEHGAFQTNTIYMRNGSLSINLFGKYIANSELIRFFEVAAQSFGVYTFPLLHESLLTHEQLNFNLSITEISKVVDIIESYRTHIGSSS